MYAIQAVLILQFLTDILLKDQDFWLLDFNGMSTCLQLFYAQKLGNCVHCMYIFTFFM